MFGTTIVKQLAYVLIATCAVFAAHVFLNAPQSAWIIWLTFLLLPIPTGKTPWERMVWVLVAGLLTTLFVSMTSFLYSPILIACYDVMLVFVGMYLGYKKPRFFYVTFVVAFLTLYASTAPIDAAGALERATLMLYATLMVAVLQLIFVPWFYRDERRMAALNMIRGMRLFNTEAFACYLEPAYPDNVYLYERRLHQRKSRVLYALSRLKRLENSEDPYSKVHQYETIYQILLDCSQLRRRVIDHTLFLLCDQELSAILATMNKIFVQLAIKVKKKHKSISTEQFDLAVKRLEASFQNVLRVTAKEPLALLFFIESLKSFKEEVDLC